MPLVITYSNHRKAWVKVKVTPWHAYEGAEGRRGYSSNPLAPRTRRRWVVSTTLQPLYLMKRHDTRCTGGWLGLGAGLRTKINVNYI